MPPRSRRPVLVAFAIAAAVIAVGIWQWRRSDEHATTPLGSAAPGSGDAGVGSRGGTAQPGAQPGGQPSGTGGGAGERPQLAGPNVPLPQPHRADGMPSDILPATPPARYQITDGGGEMYIALRGGPSASRSASSMGGDETTRQLRGRVVDADGDAVAGAIVLGGSHLTIMWGDLIAHASVESDASGAFALDVPVGEAVLAAITPASWSSIAWVPAGADAPVELRLGATARVRGAVRRGGAPEQAHLQFQVPDHERTVTFFAETGTDGRFEIQPFFPRRYQVAIGQAQLSGGGISAAVTRTVDILPGQTAVLDVELPVGGLIVVTPVLPADAHGRVETFLAPGQLAAGSAADLQAGVRDHTIDSQLQGGHDLAPVMQFHDRAAGDYTVCVDIRLQEPARTGFLCQPVTLVADAPVLEISIQVPLVAQAEE